MGPLEIRKKLVKIFVGLIMILVYVKIGMIQDIVFLAIVVYICMIVQPTKQDGNQKKISRDHRDKDGRESIILIQNNNQTT